MSKFLFIYLFIIFLFLSASIADIIHVSANQPTIQTGIDAAVDGDTVLVADNTYYENINFKGKAITVASTFLIDQDTSHVSSTVIDGTFKPHPDSGSVVYFISGEDTNSVLCGFTITGGSGTWGVYSLSSGRSGGGIMIDQSGAKIVHNIIENNQNISMVSSSYAWGGGIDAYAGTVNPSIIIKDNLIRNNSAEAHHTGTGGGMSIWLYDNALISDNVVIYNLCNGHYGYSFGGGIYCESRPENPQTMTISENIISSNQATGNNPSGQGGCGGGIAVYAINARLLNNDITNNEVSATPGNYGYGAGLWIVGGDSSMVLGNTISGNDFEGGFCRGGGIQIQENSVSLINNLISHNHATFGGGFRIYNSWEIGAANEEIIDYQKSGLSGRLSKEIVRTAPEESDNLGRQPHLINNTITHNTAAMNGGGLYVASSNLIVVNTILWNNVASYFGNEIYQTGSTLRVLYSDVTDTFPGIGNINADPSFEDTLLFHLMNTSPCIGAGIDSIQIDSVWYCCPNCDCEGGLRPNPQGTNPDMGAWESPLPTGLSHSKENISSTYNLYQNYPNPFNPVTTIEFNLPKAGKVTLQIFNVLGEEVAILLSASLLSGSHSVKWDASGLASGVYLYHLEAGGYVQTRKMILLK